MNNKIPMFNIEKYKRDIEEEDDVRNVERVGGYHFFTHNKNERIIPTSDGHAKERIFC